MDAENRAATTAEAGLFQMSHSIGVASDKLGGGWVKRHYQLLRRRYYSGLMDVFREGVVVRNNLLRGFGDTEGGLFREFCVLEPALGAELAALGIRKRLASCRIWSRPAKPRRENCCASAAS